MSEPTYEPAATASDQLLAALADEFATRLRRGERVTVEEYVAKQPQLEETIRKAFSAIAMIEESRTSDPAASGERLGVMIGRYKLLERIGEGGFGVVYMAEQLHPVRRKLALKVIKPGMDSRQVLARFEAERQALAIMDHPNIAKVLDAGATESGRPYFVMELVKGEPITEYCDRNQLEPRQRLELFVQVCQAVQHAHQKGIIHRDIKPSNVLVSVHDTKPVVKVIDFGVAKALGQELTENTLFTGFAQLLGTPLYMSPEQAGHSALDVDTRSDIYSLGVLLYELLTGTTPFDKERFRQVAEDEIRRIIREEEPPKPSTRLSESRGSLPSISAQRHAEPAKLTKLVRGELDWIVMKSLEKDRTRRYETANGLARDVERYLHDEPVHACPPSRAYRLRKFARRNKSVVAAVAAVMLTLVAGIIGTSAGLRQAVHARNAETRQRSLAQQNEAKARDEASRADQEAEKQAAINQFLNDMLAAANPQSLTADSTVRGRDVTVLQVMDEAARRLDGGSLRNSRPVEAAVRRTIGNAYVDLGQYEKAEVHLRSSLQLNQQMYGPEHPEVAKSLRALARCLSSQAKRADAQKLLHDALDMQQRILGPENAEVATTLYDLARIAAFRGNVTEMKALQGQCLQMRQKVLPPSHPDTALIMRDVAKGLLDTAKGEEMLREVLSMQQASLGPEHPECAVTMLELGRKLESRKQFKEADDVLSRTVVLQRKLFGSEHPDVATTLISAARVAEALGRVEDADRMRQQATEIRRRALGEHHPSFVRTLDATAASLERRGDLKPAESLRRQALDIRLRYHHDDPGMVPQSIVDLVENLQQQGRPEEAISEVRRVLPRQSQNPRPEESFIRCSALTILGQLLIDADRAAEAEENYHACIRLLPSVAEALPADLWKWAANRAVMGLGWLLLQQERYADAEEHYRVMLPLLRKGFGESYNCCAHLPDLIETYLGVGKAHEAERVCSEAMAMLRPNSPIHERGLVMLAQARVLAHVGTAAAADRAFAEAIDYLRNATTRPSRECDIMLSRQAEALFDAGRLADAEALRRVELDVEVALSGDTHPLVANSLIALASVLRAAGKPADAEEAARRALAIRRKRWPATNPYAVAEALLELGRTLCDEGKADDAEPLLREATALRTTAPRPNAWSIAHAKSHLGRALVMQRRYEEAEKLLVEAATTLDSSPAAWRKLRQANLERLAQLYDACGKGEEAAKLRVEALKAGNAPTTGPAVAMPTTTSPSTRP